MPEGPQSSRLRRVTGLFGLGFRGALARLRGGDSRRVLVTVVGVGIAVGFTLTVTGVAVGLAGQSTVASDDVDYWVVPEQGSSPLTVASGGVRLGDSHATARSIADDQRVRGATPVLLEFVALENPTDDTREYVLVAGVVPADDTFEVFGVSTAGLAPGDPHYANGTYDGERTDEVVLSDGAAELLNATDGGAVELQVRGAEPRRLQVVNVSVAESRGTGTFPVAVMHLSELQSITGAADGDQANQILVRTNDRSVREELDGVYPETTVIARNDVGLDRGGADDLPLAIAAAAFVTALSVGTLAVATTMGLEVTGDRQRLALLAAVGFSRRSRAVVVLAEVLTVAVVGGIAGIGVGVAGVEITNRVAAEYVADASAATFHPLFVPYGIGLAVVIGLVASLYPVYLSYRSRPLEVIDR
ncbi:ABC transporter permease [Halostella salina]|uniref:ABC transporter permease n=1 Tax=Halostella salina TaxID=1547897 RepID=UPI000EF7D3DA|nr:ABC transporter permease [Halostella salina]